MACDMPLSGAICSCTFVLNQFVKSYLRPGRLLVDNRTSTLLRTLKQRSNQLRGGNAVANSSAMGLCYTLDSPGHAAICQNAPNHHVALHPSNQNIRRSCWHAQRLHYVI